MILTSTSVYEYRSQYWYMRLFLPRCRTLHLLLLNLIWLLPAQNLIVHNNAQCLYNAIPILCCFKHRKLLWYLRCSGFSVIDDFLLIHWSTVISINTSQTIIQKASSSKFCITLEIPSKSTPMLQYIKSIAKDTLHKQL